MSSLFSGLVKPKAKMLLSCDFFLQILTMGKRRKGSKKRDAGLAGLKNAVSDDEGGVVGEDGVLGEVEQWENDEDQRILGNVQLGRRRKDEGGPKEVFALSGTDSDSDLELPDIKKMRKQKYKKKEPKQEENVDSDLGSVGDEKEEQEDLKRWGRKKKSYYGGNTGQEMEEDLDDSDLEENKMEEIEAAKLQSKQLEMMEEEDFLDTFVPKKIEEKKKKTQKVEVVDSVAKDFSKLTTKEQSKLFRQQNPEFDGVVADLHHSLAEAAQLSKVVSLAEAGDLPAGPCLDFVRYKLEILLNYSTNISTYLMFKAKGINLTLHPVTGRLVQYRQLLDQVESVGGDVMEQVNSLLSGLGKGEDVKTLVKEEKRRVARELKRKNSKPLKFKKLEPESAGRKGEKKKKKDEKESPKAEEGLTRDEQMALEVYQAMRKKKEDVQQSEDESENEDVEEEEAEESTSVPESSGNTYNNENEDLEEDDLDIDDGKRGITYKIAKNKGLTPKRSKLQRNPRVKNRVKYQKAMKRRKGAVREVRDQNTKYGGEASGINMRVKKGVKFN